MTYGYIRVSTDRQTVETQPFIYLGQGSTFPGSAEGNKPITMKFALHSRVPDELFNDFITRTDKMGKNSDN